MALQLFANIDRNTLASGLVFSSSNLNQKVAPQLVAGDKISIDLYLTSRDGLLDIQDYSNVKIALGAPNAKPTGGTYKIDYGGTSNVTLNFDATAQDFADAINTNAPTVPSPVTGTEIAPFVYIIDFGSNGSCDFPTIDSSTLSPASTVNIQRLTTGDSNTKEQWLVRLYENPIALVDTWTDIEIVTDEKGIRGSLNLGTQGIYDLLDNSASAISTIELEIEDSNGNLQTIFQSPITINSQVIGQSISGVIPSPSGIPAEAATFLNSFPDPAIIGNLSVGGFDLSTGASAGYVLTSDADGNATWQVNRAAENKGYFATSSELATAYPSGEEGFYAIVGATDTFWVWDEDTSAWIDSNSGSLGSVTSVSVSGGTGITASGSPVTTSGTITVGLDTATQNTLSDVANKAPLADPDFTGTVGIAKSGVNGVLDIDGDVYIENGKINGETGSIDFDNNQAQLILGTVKSDAVKVERVDASNTLIFGVDASSETDGKATMLNAEVSNDLTVSKDVEIGDPSSNTFLKIHSETEANDEITIKNGGLVLEDGGIEITGGGEVEFTNGGSVILDNDGEILLGTDWVQDGQHIIVAGKHAVSFEATERYLADAINGQACFVFTAANAMRFTGTDAKVGILKNPNCELDVAGKIHTDYLEVANDFDVSGDLAISGNVVGDVNIQSGSDLDLDVYIKHNSSNVGDQGTRFGFSGDNEISFLIKFANVYRIFSPSANKYEHQFVGAVAKKNTFFRDGAVRIQKSTSGNDELSIRYEGQSSNNILLQQYSGGAEKGQIKFLGNNTIRIDATNIDIGYNRENKETELIKLFSDTNIAAEKKLTFVDSRNEDHGLHFKHSNQNAPTFQFGMAGEAYNDADFGQFKITHTNQNDVTENVIVVDKDNGYIKLESDLTEMKNAKVADGGYTQVGSFDGTPYPSNPQEGMIIFDSANGVKKFKGYNGSSWDDLN